MKISIASDHGGYALKEELSAWLTSLGHQVEDFGCRGLDSCDYADFCEPAALAVAEGNATGGSLSVPPASEHLSLPTK